MEGLYRITDLEELDYHEEIPEESDTLEGNALMKARHVFSIFSKDCFADDTGLEVRSWLSSCDWWRRSRMGVKSSALSGPFVVTVESCVSPTLV